MNLEQSLNRMLKPIFLIFGCLFLFNISLSGQCDPVLTVSTTQPSSCVATNGIIGITPNTPGIYQYSIDGGNTWSGNNSFFDLTIGSYVIVYRRLDGSCELEYDANPVNLTFTTSPTIEAVNAANPSDCDLTDGMIMITGSGGTMPLFYSIDGGANFAANSTFTNLDIGTYDIIVANNDLSCQMVYPTFDLTTPPPVAFVGINKTDVLDCNADNGTISMLISGGIGSAEFSVDNGATWSATSLFTDLTAGDYDLMIRNSDGSCAVAYMDNPVTVFEPSPPSINMVSSTDPTGCGLDDGTITIDGTSGSSSIEYSVDNGASWTGSGAVLNLAPGDYNIKTRNSDGSCQVSYTSNPVVLTSPAGPEITNVNTTNPSDCNTNDGQIEITSVGGINVEYSINGGETWSNNNILGGLGMGVYDVFVRQSDGTCLAESSDNPAILTLGSAPLILSVLATDPTECGLDDGFIYVKVFGGVQPLQYSIDAGLNFQVSNSFPALSHGIYDIVVTNNDGSCPNTYPTLELEEQIAPTINSVDITEQTGCVSADGSIIINATQGSDEIEYSIDDGMTWSNSNTYTNLDYGTYDIRLRNENGNCEVTYVNNPVVVDFPDEMDVSTISTTIPSACATPDGSITVEMLNDGDFEFSVDHGATWSPNNILSNLTAGNYFLLIRKLDASCEVSYDNNPITIVDPDGPVIIEVVSTNLTNCDSDDGTISITADLGGAAMEYSVNSGGSWSSSSTFTGLLAGGYTIVVRDMGGNCWTFYENSPVIIVEPTPPEFDQIIKTNATDCNLSDGAISITTLFSGDYEYSIDAGNNWSTDENFNNLPAGSYVLKIRNSTGTCEVDYSNNPVNVIAPNSPLISNVSITNSPDCGENEGVISITGLPGMWPLHYSIDSGATYQNGNVFDHLSPGFYDVMVANTDYSCPISYPTLEITEPVEPVFDQVINQDITDCGLMDGSISITASSPNGTSLEYSINNGSNWSTNNEYSNLSTGNYFVRLRNVGATCQMIYGSSPVVIGEPILPTITQIDSSSPTDCNASDGTITFDIQGNSDYDFSIDNGLTWTADSAYINLESGSFDLLVRNVDGTCETPYSNNPLILNDPALPTFSTVNSTNVSDCDAGDGYISINVIPNGNQLEYSINNGVNWIVNSTINNLGDGEYYIMIRNDDGTCEVPYPENPIIITSPILPEYSNVSVSSPTNCDVDDGTILIETSGNEAYEYSIDGGTSWQLNNNFTNLAPDSYDVVIRNADETCENVYVNNPVMVSELIPPVIASISSTNPTDCGVEDGTIQVNMAQAGVYEYSIDNGLSWIGTNLFEDLAPESFNVMVRNDDGTCEVLAVDNPVILMGFDLPEINNIILTDLSDCNSDDGMVEIMATSPSADLEYSIDGGINWTSQNVFNNLALDSYDVQVRNDDGTCSVEAINNPQILSMPQTPVLSNVSFTSPTNCGINDGTISISTMVQGVYEYSVNGGITWDLNPEFTNLSPDDYNVAVRNINGTCVTMHIDNPLVLEEMIAPEISTISIFNISNCNVIDGAIEIEVDGNAIYEYSIDEGATWSSNNIFNDLEIGDYNIGVRNSDTTCEVFYAQNPMTITTPVAADITNVVLTNPSDCEIQDGTIEIQTDAQGALEYSIDGGQTWSENALFDNLQEGSFDVMIRNSDGGTCMVDYPTNPMVMSAPIAPEISAVSFSSPTNCGLTDGIISITPMLAENYEYSVDEGDTWLADGEFLNLPPASYNIAIRNMDGTCVTMHLDNPIVLEEMIAPEISNVVLIDISDCNVTDGSIMIEVDGSAGYEYSIDGGTTWGLTNTFSDLQIGNYNIGIRNTDTTCEVFYAQNPMTITTPIAADITNVVLTNPSDCEIQDGTIEIQTDAQVALEYSIDGGQTWSENALFDNLQEGSFDVMIRNSDGGTCMVDYPTNPMVMSAPIAPEISAVSFSSPTNCGITDGIISITPMLAENYEYSVDEGDTWLADGEFLNLPPATYNIAIRNMDGTCVTMHVDNPIVLEEMIAPEFSTISIENSSDCNANDGLIQIAASGNNDYEYSIDGGLNWSVESSFENLVAGSYDVMIRNEDGTCEVNNVENPVVITTPIEPEITEINITDVTDCNLTDGILELTTSDDIADLELSIDNGISWFQTLLFTDLAKGSYNIMIRNIDGTCEFPYANNPIMVESPEAPTIVDVHGTSPSICEINDGLIEIETGEEEDYEYSIDGGTNWQSTNVFSDLTFGVYDIAVRNIDGTCMTMSPSNPVTLQEPFTPEIQSVNVIDPTNCNVEDGTIEITANGTGAYEYSIDNGLTWSVDNNYSNLQAGEFNLMIRNMDGTCEISASDNPIVLVEMQGPQIDNITFNNQSDCNVLDATINISTIENEAYEYSIDGGTTWDPNGEFSSLLGGEYMVMVRNINGTCMISYDANPIQIVEPIEPQIMAVSSSDPSTCESNDGGIMITDDGMEVYEYSVDGGDTWVLNNSITNLESGSYDIMIRKQGATCAIAYDQNPVTINNTNGPEIVAVDFNDPSDCGMTDGSILVNAIGGDGDLQYSMDNGLNFQSSPIFSSLSDGDYNIVIANSDLTCAYSYQTITLSVLVEPAFVSVNPSPATDCAAADGSIEIVATDGSNEVEFSIDGGTSWNSNGMFTDLAAGMYDLMIRNTDETCAVAYDQNPIIFESVDAPVFADVVPTAPTDCDLNNGSILITMDFIDDFEYSIDGGLTWQPNAQITNLSPGAYNVFARFVEGDCETAYENNPLIVSASNGPVITSIDANDPTDCAMVDGSIFIFATGGFNPLQYSIDGGLNFQPNSTFTSLAGGTYDIIVGNNDISCQINYGTITLSDPVAAEITAINIVEPSGCDFTGGSIEITANVFDDVEFSIDGGLTWQEDHSFSNLIENSYDLMIRNIDGSCETSYDNNPVALVETPAPFFQNVEGLEPSSCEMPNGSISITTVETGAFEYSIDGGIIWIENNVFTNLNSGSFNLMIRNLDGTCETSYVNNPLILNGLDLPVITEVLNTNPSSCAGTDGTISITTQTVDTYEYSIDDGMNWTTESTFTDLVAGSYDLMVRNADGTCETIYSSNPVQINAADAPTVTLVQTNPTGCGIDDGLITITGSGGVMPLQYSIDGGITYSSNNTFSNLGGGTYDVIVVNNTFSCPSISQQVVFTSSTAPSFGLVSNTPVSSCDGNDGSFSIMASGDTDLEYSIDGGMTWFVNNVFSDLEVGSYDLMIRNIDGTCEVAFDNNPYFIDQPADCCEDIVNEEVIFLQVSNCSDFESVCIDIPFLELDDYQILNNGMQFTGSGSVLGCNLQLSFQYVYTSLPGLGMDGPYSFDDWEVDGEIFSGEVETIIDLVDSMNVWDPTGNWEININSFMISGGNPNSSYSDVIMTQTSSGSTIPITVNSSLLPMGTALNVTSGTYNFSFTNNVTACSDELELVVACIIPEYINQTVEVNDTDTLCLSTDELMGETFTIENVCESSSGEYVLFEIIDDFCITYTGIEEGEENACFVICDEYALCDTTYINVEAELPDLEGDFPIAFNDVDTILEATTMIINVAGNDFINGEFDTLYIVDQPANGTLILNPDFTLHYQPNDGYCDGAMPDSMSYAICNRAGCDTASVYIYVVCDEIRATDGFSPNGDGINDAYVIRGIEFYPNNELFIYNRWGNQVYYKKAYRNDWLGTWKNGIISSGTYFYLLHDGEGKTYSGYLQVHQ